MHATSLRITFLALIAFGGLSACSESPPTLEQKRVLDLAAAQAAKEVAMRAQQLSLCQTAAVAEFNAHMAARRHTEAAAALRLCASALPDQNLKRLFADAESKAFVDDVENPKSSTFEKVHAIEMLMEYYPDVGRKYEVRGAELSMKLPDEQKRNAEAVRATQSPSIGMSADDLEASRWGRPASVNRTTTSNGISEQWVYGGNRYVYVKNGRVVSIQD
jgi:hypothetical protein